MKPSACDSYKPSATESDLIKVRAGTATDKESNIANEDDTDCQEVVAIDDDDNDTQITAKNK